MKSNKSLDCFLELSKRTLSMDSIKALVVESSFDEKVSWHRVYERLIDIEKRDAVRTKMILAYPFVKIGGKWHFSAVSNYMFLLRSRSAIIKTNHPSMRLLHDAIQNADKYCNDARRLFEELSPTVFGDLQTYQEELSKIYESHMVRQQSLFEKM